MKQLNETTYEVLLKGSDRVEVGNQSASKFIPHIKLNRWFGECFLECSIIDDGLSSLVIDTEKAKLKWFNSKIESHFYPLDSGELGGFEWAVILKEKPEINILVWDIKTKGLEFYYQPALSQEEINEGAFRPENVVGSYAVYRTDKTHIFSNKTNAEKYKCGKAFHIYRPKITDDSGRTIWGVLNINQQTEKMTVTIDQNWLDDAVYPVMIDPTFGYATLGASSFSLGSITDYMRARIGNPGENGTIDSVSAGLSVDSGESVNIKGGVYKDSDMSLQTPVGAAIAVNSNTKQWWTSVITSGASISNQDYFAAWIGDGTALGGGKYIYQWYDSGGVSGDSIWENGITYPTWPDPWTTGSASSSIYSIYCTYTLAATIVTPSTLTLELTLQTPNLSSSYMHTPSALALASTLQTPTIVLSPIISPDTLALEAALQTPIVTGATLITPSSLALALALQTPGILFSSTVSPSTLALDLSLQTPVIITIHPGCFPLELGLLTPEIIIDYTASPSTFALALTQPTPVVYDIKTILTSILSLEASLGVPDLLVYYADIPSFMHKDLIDPYSGGAWIWLCEIAMPGQTTRRIARNTENITYDNEVFEKFNLQIGEQIFSGDGSIPRVTLRIFQDANRIIENMVNETEGALGANIKLIRVNEKFLNTPVSALEADYDSLASESDTEWVTFTLGIPNPLTQRFPLRIYSSSMCPWATPSLFKGPECQYTGPDGTCTGTYEDCYTKGNAVHWGAELGLDANVVRV